MKRLNFNAASRWRFLYSTFKTANRLKRPWKCCKRDNSSEVLPDGSAQQRLRASQLVQDGRQKRSGWFVVQAFAHQSHWLRNSQVIGETPAKQLAVAGRKEKPRTGEFRGCADERLYIFVCLTDGMTKKANDGGVTGNSCVVFCDNRGTLRC